jgi:hypothetical protein
MEQKSRARRKRVHDKGRAAPVHSGGVLER